MFKRGLVALAIVAGALGVAAAPAQAIPPNPLIVTHYYDTPNKTNLVGQRWHGCSQPSGSWGQATSYSKVTFVPC